MPTFTIHLSRCAKIAVFCCVILLAAGYTYYQSTFEQYRTVEEMNTLVRGWKAVRIRSEKLLTTMTRDANASNSDLEAMNEEFAAVRNRFLALDKRLKAKNNGVVPQWLKDNQTWQQLNYLFSASRS
jgi:hypothetical protein